MSDYFSEWPSPLYQSGNLANRVGGAVQPDRGMLQGFTDDHL